MAANDTVIRLVADLELSGADAVAKQIKRLARDANIGFDERDFLKKWATTSKRVQSSFADTIGDALKAGLSTKNLRGLTNTWSQLSKQIEKAQAGGADEAAKIHLRELEKRFKLERAHVEKINRRRQAAIRESQRWQGKKQAEIAEDFAKNIRDAFGSLKSGDFAGVIKGAGKGAQGLGGAAMKTGASKGGGMGKALQGIGKFLARLGPMLLAVGAIVGAVGALISVIVMADAKIKELNRSLLEGGVAGAEMADRYDDVSKKMTNVRQAFTSGDGAFAFNRIWGTTAQDHLQILGAYAQAGKSIKDITAGARDARQEMKALRDHTQAALAYSKLLGVSAQELAGNMASWMEDLGENIQGVQSGLSAVTMAAKESGFGVKRFFGMVLQATSGMSMYNVRLEEAGSLLIRLGKILGAKVGGDFLQQLTKGFAGEGMQDRYRRVMHTKGMKGIMGRSASNTAEDFMRKLGPEGQKALASAGIDPQKDLVKQLGRLNAKDQSKVLAKFRRSGVDSDLARVLENLMGLSQGAEGGRAAQAMNLGSLDAGGKLMAMLIAGQKVINKPIHEMNIQQLMAMEQFAGMSGEQLEIMRRMSRAMHGQWDDLQEMNKRGETLDLESEEAKNLVKSHGAIVADGPDGRGVYSANIGEDGAILLGKKLDVLGDYVQTQGDTFREAAQEGVPADIRLASQIAANTTDMTTILKQGVEYWLEEINQAVWKIANYFGGLNETEARRKDKLVQGYIKEIQEIRKQERKASRAVADAKAAVASSTGKDRELAQENLVAAQDRLSTIRQNRGVKAAELEHLRGIESSAWFGDHDTADFKEMIQEKMKKMSVRDMGEFMVRGGAMSSQEVEATKQAATEKLLAAEGVGSVAELKEKQSGKRQEWLDGIAGYYDIPGGGTRPEMSDGSMPQQAEQMIEAAHREALTRYRQVDQRDQKRLHGKGGEAPKAAATEIQKMLDRRASADLGRTIKGVLGSAGVDMGMREAQALASEYQRTGELPAEIKNRLSLKTSSGKTVQEMLGLPVGGVTATPTNDLLMHISSRGVTRQPISSFDDVSIAAGRKGFPLDRAGGGGRSVTVHMHNYNDTRGWQNNQEKLRRVLTGRVG